MTTHNRRLARPGGVLVPLPEPADVVHDFGVFLLKDAKRHEDDEA
jgi:hypothetical protein